MLLFAGNVDNMFLNIIVGYLSKDYIKTSDTQSVEEDNYFAEEFIKSEQKVAGLTRRKVIGSHLINVAGKPHFSFTYLRKFFFSKMYSRQYSIILSHPQSTY